VNNDLVSKMNDRLDRDEEWVALQPGETLMMTVEEVETVDGKFGPYVTVRGITPDGDPKVFGAYHSVPKARFEKNPPNPGDFLGIRYLGLVESKDGGHEYHGYRISVERIGKAPEPEVEATPTELRVADALESNVQSTPIEDGSRI
jgi:hypothetical protein